MILEGRAAQLARRRAQLISRAESQRYELAAHVDHWQGPLSIADKALAGARFLRAHPPIVAAAALALAVFGRRKLWKIVRGGWFLWRSWRALRAYIAKLPSAPARRSAAPQPR
jgi:hypothetical protein